MAEESAETMSRCLTCGFEAPDGSTEWDLVDVPSLGTLTQCPECASTNVLTGR